MRRTVCAMATGTRDPAWTGWGARLRPRRAEPATEPNNAFGERLRQHVAHVRVPIVIERINQILNMQTGFDVAFDAQAALQEQRVRVLATPDQIEKIAQATAYANRRRARCHGHEATRAELKRGEGNDIVNVGGKHGAG